jgi:carbonic anhydrase
MKMFKIPLRAFTVGVASLFLVSACSTASSTQEKPAAYVTFDAEQQKSTSPEAAFAALKAGNERFTAGKRISRDYAAQVQQTSKGQFPFAAVLSCLDSRVPPEIVFDQGIGDMFVGRVAGNVVTDDLVGSFEFATKVAGAKLLVVMGHTQCGAIKGACDNVKLGNLTGLLQKFEPAIAAVADDGKPRNSKNHDFVEAVAEANVKYTMAQLQERSPILKGLVEEGKLKIVGGIYHLEDGKVHFFD